MAPLLALTHSRISDVDDAVKRSKGVRARKSNMVSPGMGELAMWARSVHLHYVAVPKAAAARPTRPSPTT